MMFDDTMNMNYDEFIAYIKERMEEALEDADVRDIRIVPAVRNNQVVMDALQISWGHERPAPLIYLDSYYEDYRKGVPVAVLIHNMTVLCLESLEGMGMIPLQDIPFFERIRSRIILRLVNAGKNAQLLEECPHRVFAEDLAITYRILAGHTEGGISTILITNELMDAWDLTEEDLHGLACENSLRLFPPSVETVRQMLERTMGEAYGDAFPGRADDPDNMLYLLSNDCRINGASVICYSDVIRNFADTMDSDFYVIPSSIHEVILVPTRSEVSPHHLKEILMEANRSVLQKEDILGDGVYFYTRSSGKIEKYSGQIEGNLLQ